ncbi:MAG TPA: hypothetical protein VL283_05520 [Candidatus Baltobacteraceae bacterium]|nr:hypothetical protein [Candidatus Baltobacteraceae bacterium]
MISKLKELSEDTMLAEGPRFDLEKVLTEGSALLRTLIGRAQMRFPEAEPMTIVSETDDFPASVESLDEVEKVFRKVKEDWYDAADLHFYVQFGPYIATWAPLGFDALYGPACNCLTSSEANWEDLDPTPVLFFMNREKPFHPLGPRATKFLKEILGDEKADGVQVDYVPHDADAEIVVVRFTHGAFGAGRGSIRVCRYVDEEDWP